ncbi:MAG: glutamine-hydrolyzing GMP synthase [bacterium]
MSKGLPSERVLILDFGAQYTQLIARRIRESRVYCEIWPYSRSLEAIRAFAPRGIVLSGGPASLAGREPPLCDRRVLDLDVPILGICYGQQLLAHQLGGEVQPAQHREFGSAEIEVDGGCDLFHGLGDAGSRLKVWMSHGDRVERMPPGFVSVAKSASSPFAAMASTSGPTRVGVQFHPEVVHTPQGRAILDNFVFRICGLAPTWTMGSFTERAIEGVREQVGNGRIVLALSGGVDSSVVALLLHRAVGDRLTCIFVDNGLLRMHEAERVRDLFETHFRVPVRCVDAADRFLRVLEGVTDPELKRKRIGYEFISVFEEEAARIGDVGFLAQGTLYPDVIESVSERGPSATIKSHHNVGGLPERMKLALVEPLRELFKDEVREVGRELGLPEEIVRRQPFPGPGLAVRIVGPITRPKLDVLRQADLIVQDEIREAGLYDHLWQAFAVLLPVRSVGVMGDERTYEEVIAVRCVESQDGMTADWARLPSELLARISNRIINEVRGVNRVVYDISSKPPSTIEWE